MLCRYLCMKEKRERRSRVTNTIQAAKKNVAIIDEFQTKTIDLDADGTPDISHGDLVEAYLKATNPNVKTEKFPITYQDPGKGTINKDDVFKAFDNISTKIQKGEKFDAVNFSVGSGLNINDLSKKINNKMTKDNISTFKPQIKDYVSKNLPNVNKDIAKIEKVTDKGVPVYIAAGNDKESHYNLYGLAKGTKSIGATDYTGKVANFSANNQDVSKYEKGTYVPRITSNNKGKITGVDINNDGKKDLPAKILSSANKPKNPSFGSGGLKDISTINGTSFSTPVALAKDLSSSSETTSSKLSSSESKSITSSDLKLKSFGPK